MALKRDIFHFFQEYLDPGRPVLLGLSGGADSMLLFHMLKEYGKLPYGIAHVDHTWRTESAEEAAALKKIAEKEKVPFHLKTLDPSQSKGNLEDACRRERVCFFTELCKTHGYQGVLLGHHADDQAETVLKRVLEGAALSNIAGIAPVKMMEGTPFFRPLLTTTKKQILEFLALEEVAFFDDPTNRDPQFLRARMRESLIPMLSEKFGKNVMPALCSVADEAREVSEYLDVQVEHYLHQAIRGPMGLLIDMSVSIPAHDVELKHLIRYGCREMGVMLSRNQYQKVCLLVRSGAADKKIENGCSVLYIDRQRLFILPRQPESLPCGIELNEGCHEFGPWKVSVAEGGGTGNGNVMGWQAAWKGGIAVSLPKGRYILRKCPSTTPYHGKRSVGKLWTDQKTPAWMREYVPAIFTDHSLVHELLTGREYREKSEGQLTVLITHNILNQTQESEFWARDISV